MRRRVEESNCKCGNAAPEQQGYCRLLMLQRAHPPDAARPLPAKVVRGTATAPSYTALRPWGGEPVMRDLANARASRTVDDEDEVEMIAENNH